MSAVAHNGPLVSGLSKRLYYNGLVDGVNFVLNPGVPISTPATSKSRKPLKTGCGGTYISVGLQ